jgi:hypothetical protein
MTIDRWGSMAASSSPRPQVAPRTPCAPCTARGHHCDAFDIVGGRAVCMHCLDGVDCPRTPRNGVVDAPGKRLPAARCLPDKGQATRAIAVHEELAVREEPLAASPPRAPMVDPVCTVALRGPNMTMRVAPKRPIFPPASLQPALAPGAEPSAAMPARRVFGSPPTYKGKVQARARAKEMLASGMSMSATVAATGLSKGTVSSVRKELPGLPRAGTGGVPRKAAELSAAAAEQVVAEAEAITAQVADEVERRSVTEGELGTKSKEVSSKLKEEHAVFPVAAAMGTELGASVSAPIGVTANGTASAGAEEWAWVERSSVPDCRTHSIYDDAVGKLRAAPLNKSMTRTFANAEIAETYMKGIARRAREAGVAAGSRQDGATIYLWRKA